MNPHKRNRRETLKNKAIRKKSCDSAAGSFYNTCALTRTDGHLTAVYAHTMDLTYNSFTPTVDCFGSSNVTLLAHFHPRSLPTHTKNRVTRSIDFQNKMRNEIRCGVCKLKSKKRTLENRQCFSVCSEKYRV